MRKLLYAIATLLVTAIGLAMLGRQTEQDLAERQHYDKVRTATEELLLILA